MDILTIGDSILPVWSHFYHTWINDKIPSQLLSDINWFDLKSSLSDMKETQERRDAEMRALQKDLLEYKEQMKNSLEEVGNAC